MINKVNLNRVNYKGNKGYNACDDNKDNQNGILSKTEYTPYGNPYKESSVCKAVFPAVTLAYKMTTFLINKNTAMEAFAMLSAQFGKNFSKLGFALSSIFSIGISTLFAGAVGSICDSLGNSKRAKDADIAAINKNSYK